MVEIKLCRLSPDSAKSYNTGYTYQNSSWKQYQGMDTYYGARSNGILNTDDWHSQEWILENIITYTREFGNTRIFTWLSSAQSYENRRQRTITKFLQELYQTKIFSLVQRHTKQYHI